MFIIRQSLTQSCICGSTMGFPEGEVRAKCDCGVNWELSLEGFWSIHSVPFMQNSVSQRHKRLIHYENYVRWRNKNLPKSKRRRKSAALD